ncbi:hypothetical protein ACFW6X_31225 [Streptomyces bacillaris]|uniref:hypothetical protein n=1 Tax=Streptomyces bacillaris TaxID=68179 RepID=UPI0036952003
MDPALLALATASANSLINLLTSDAWEKAKLGISRLFGRSDQGTAEEAGRELELNRQELLSSISRDDVETVDELRAAWRGKFRRLLSADPEAEEILREILTEWNPEEAQKLTTNVITQSASASDHGRVYQQGSGTQINY